MIENISVGQILIVLGVSNWHVYSVPIIYTRDLIMRYSVHCPSAPFENTSFVSLDDCWGVCLDLSEEYGYAEVRHGDIVIGSYTNGE